MNRDSTIPGAAVALADARTIRGGDFQTVSRLSKDEKASVILPFRFWAVAMAMAGWGVFSANPILTPTAVLMLAAIIQLLWRRGEPPILVFACTIQWLQASAVIFYTDFYKVSLEQAGGGPELETATWLSLVAVLVLALGMRLALVRCRRSVHGVLLFESSQVNIASAFVVYLVTFGIATVAGIVAWKFPGFSQEIYALTALKWFGVFILAYCVLEQGAGYIFLISVVVLEVAVGSLGFFAGFKSVFFVLLVVALTSPFALRGRRLLLAVGAVAALFFFGVVWSAIKTDYRQFLNQGTGEQVVAVTVEESAEKLGDLLSNFTWDNFSDGLDAMILRVSYVNYFALTLMNVPDHVPHENGALWLGALKHIVTPRLFFPEKAAISDSERTTLYTGVQIAGAEQGTSIGIGYVAESYVDFGQRRMFAPIFLLGVFYGLIYRAFVLHSHRPLLGSAVAASILIFGAYAIETSNIKIVGGNVTALIVMTLILKFAGGPLWKALATPVWSAR